MTSPDAQALCAEPVSYGLTFPTEIAEPRLIATQEALHVASGELLIASPGPAHRRSAHVVYRQARDIPDNAPYTTRSLSG